jgi:hypothetical protein
MAKIEMPKNAAGNPEVDVIAEDITTALARIDWLLNGNVDVDNMAHKEIETAERKLLIPASKVQDIPLISNEIQSSKFFTDDEGVSFVDMAWNPLKNKAIANPLFTVVEAQGSLSYGSVVLENKNPTVVLLIEAEIPSTHVPVTYKRMFDVIGVDGSVLYDKDTIGVVAEDYVVQIIHWCDSNMETINLDDTTKLRVSLDLEKCSFNSKTNTISATIAAVGSGEKLNESDFFNIFTTMYVLCEERI